MKSYLLYSTLLLIGSSACDLIPAPGLGDETNDTELNQEPEKEYNQYFDPREITDSSSKKLGDLYRFPLKNEFEMYSLEDNDDWYFMFDSQMLQTEWTGKPKRIAFDKVLAVGISKQFIMLESDNFFIPGHGLNPSTLIIDYKHKKAWLYSNSFEFKEMEAKKTSLFISMPMHNFEEVKTNFIERGVLPYEWKK